MSCTVVEVVFISHSIPLPQQEKSGKEWEGREETEESEKWVQGRVDQSGAGWSPSGSMVEG